MIETMKNNALKHERLGIYGVNVHILSCYSAETHRRRYV
jgi:hypothetical protein